MSGMGKFDGVLIAKRIGSAVVDGSIEIAGGLLGSYFGVMIAALLVAVRDEPAEALQHSMWHGMGFGFVFWALSVGFINRVLIQGVSRASIGKKVFKLELISSGNPLTWSTMMNRWILSYVSFAAGGLGFAYLFFNREGQAFHDVIARTDVVPVYVGSTMEVEYRETIVPQIPLSLHGMSRLMIFSNPQAERPMATIIRLPARALVDAAVAMSSTVPGSIADVIELRPSEEAEKKVA